MTADPWRYCCPHCGSTQITKRVTYGKGQGLEAPRPYYCENGCGRIENRLDKKTGKLEQ